MALFELVPGFWRIAKPESFFEVAWLAILCIAARELARIRPSRLAVSVLATLFVTGWLLAVRSHPVFPVLTRFVPIELSGHWQRGLPKTGTLPAP